MTKLPTISPNPLQQRLEVLKTQFPEIFADGKLSLPKLQELLGESVDTSRERFGLTWAGRADAVRALQNGTTATLRPDRAQSLEFDTTGNLILEGDNLEVLKLLQHAYHRQVKLIYIDPPYNTGNDFVYPDDFRDGARAYRRFSGQVDEDGNATTTDQGSGGRLHSRWLNMMYPRLQLAKSLLRDDGVIFISIDDNEVANLRLVMDEIFGPENHIGTLIWQRRQRADNRNENNFSTDHEYLLCYGRSDSSVFRGESIDKSKYTNPDNDPRGPWASIDLSGLATAEQRPNLHYDIVDPATGICYPPNPNRGWSKSRERMGQMISEGRILFPSKPEGRPREKKFLADIQRENTGFSSVLDNDVVGFTTNGTRDLTEIFGERAFDFPKPVVLIQTIIEQITKQDDIVLDFFAGSGTTGQAVFEANMKDGGNRRFILIQLPEPLNNTNYPTITSVTRARVRKVGEAKRAAVNGSLGMEGALDLGFRAFRWDTSNFKQYDPHAEDQMEMMKALQQNVLEGRSTEDQLFEILLRAGLPLSSRYEVVRIGGQHVYSVQGGKLLICLARPIHEGTLRAMLTHSPKPEQVVCLDVAFESENPDAVKMNIVSEMRDHGIQFRTV
ncbi:site-specific DNA-methyltransferase [Deinococcus radiotolerans]|uniref:Adenine methyltransferase n=1 Tax=Deinococcus radiotolerans TaxID=1309407 RepID=A0ABQ2FQL0_9DEIO|nr:site-specific DNA-methyltransferase [Deinococcus radiotolerans]GGL16743.1 adenine methyltransferase [Deinococcus radiotolerans]